MDGIQKSPKLELQIIATGMHLSPEFGLTYREIEKDGSHINKKIEMLVSSDKPNSVSKSMGLALIGFADAFEDIKPDWVLVLGDRFEILSAVTAAMNAGIPVAHLHGGEATEGLIDEAIRHSVTKMSHLHFVSAEEYRNRVIQLGEQPSRVFVVGGLGIENIVRLKLLKRKELEKFLNFTFGEKNLLVTFHPVTLERSTSENQMKELLSVLDDLKATNIIFTMPNADTGSRIIFTLIEGYVKTHTNCKVYTSLGQLGYLSCIKYVDGVVGNSSSGIIEAPSFKKGTINIGDRQLGRLKAKSVIDCKPTKKSISFAIETLYSDSFQKILNNVINPYEQKDSSKKIINILESISDKGILKKRFFDMKSIA